MGDDGESDWSEIIKSVGVGLLVAAGGGAVCYGLHRLSRSQLLDHVAVVWSKIADATALRARDAGLSVDTLPWVVDRKAPGKIVRVVGRHGPGRYVAMMSTITGEVFGWKLVYEGEETRVIREFGDEVECIHAALVNASRGAYLADCVRWTEVRRSVVASADELMVRVRRSPWPGIWSLFVLSGSTGRLDFDHRGDGSLAEMKVKGAEIVLDRSLVRSLPEPLLLTGEGHFVRWRYTEEDQCVIAVAESGRSRQRLCYGERREFQRIISTGSGDLIETARSLAPLMKVRAGPWNVDDVEIAGPVLEVSSLAEIFLGLRGSREAPESDRAGAASEEPEPAVEDVSQDGVDPVPAVEDVSLDGVEPESAVEDVLMDSVDPESAVEVEDPPIDAADTELPSWAAELLIEVPEDWPEREREAASWIVRALARATRAGAPIPEEDPRGSQKRLLPLLAAASDDIERAPERHSFGKALKWIATKSKVIKRRNRQSWVLRLSAVPRD